MKGWGELPVALCGSPCAQTRQSRKHTTPAKNVNMQIREAWENMLKVPKKKKRLRKLHTDRIRCRHYKNRVNLEGDMNYDDAKIV